MVSDDELQSQEDKKARVTNTAAYAFTHRQKRKFSPHYLVAHPTLIIHAEFSMSALSLTPKSRKHC